MDLCLPRWWTLHVPLLNFMRFLHTQLSWLWRSLWMAAQPCRLSTAPLSFVSANLVRVYSSSLSRSLLNKLSKIRPSTDPWGALLTRGLQQVCHWSQPSELCQSGSSQAYHTAHSSSPHFLQGKCWKPCWSQHRQHIPLFPYLPALSFHPGRLSHWFSMIPHGESMLTTPDDF